MNFPVNILTLHHCSNQKDDLTICPQTLEAMIISSKKSGFNFISYNDFKDIIFGRKKARKNEILLTFDDGYYDNFAYAFKILQKHKIPCVIFLITSKIKNYKRVSAPKFVPHKDIYKDDNFEQFLNLEEIKIMQNSNLIDFDSHTSTHFDCNSQDEAILKDELNQSLQKIQELFPDKEEFGFCWPKGEFNAKSLEIIKNSSYSFAFSTLDGAYVYGDNPFTIRRVDISVAKKGQKDYLRRVKRKLLTFRTPFFGKFYSNYKNKKQSKAKL